MTDKKRHTFVIAVLGVVLFGPTLAALDLSRYRNFELGSDLASISTLTGVAVTEATTLHQRPALLQDLEWRPSHWIAGSIAESTDPVQQVVFSFYNDRLFRIAIDYDHDRTEGLTDAEVIDSISVMYGAALGRASRPAHAPSVFETGSGTVVARWGDATYGAVLYQSSLFHKDFRLVVTDIALDGLAQKAATDAIRLDQQEAPRREMAERKQQEDDSRAADEKTRSANKEGFKP